MSLMDRGKEMMQPCLIYLHAISLVAHSCPAGRRVECDRQPRGSDFPRQEQPLPSYCRFAAPPPPFSRCFNRA